MSLVEVVCDVSSVIVIFGPAPNLEFFRQHFGMGGPLQLLCPQWANGSMVMALSNQGRDEAAIIPRNVSRRPPMACQHPHEKHQVVNFMDVTHIKYH